MGVVNGISLHHETSGHGPTILMMHGGLGLDHSYLRHHHDHLAERFRIVFYDHRGNGRSARDVGHADHSSWHADASALLEHLEVPQAIVYGHSYGAWLALGFALAYPEKVQGLVLCSVSAAFDYVSEVLDHVQRSPSAVSQRFLGLLTNPPATDEDFRAAWLDILPLYFHGPARSQLFDRTVYSAEGHRLGSASMGSYDVRTRLAGMRIPTLVIAGTHDFITPPREGRNVAAAIASAEYVELGASGHFPFAEEPDAYRAALTDWLDRL